MQDSGGLKILCNECNECNRVPTAAFLKFTQVPGIV